MALARSEESPERFYSMSAQIRLERNAYYGILETTQKVAWISPIGRSGFSNASRAPSAALRTPSPPSWQTDSFWEAHASDMLNERQVKILNRLLDGFEGKLTSSKWAAMNHCSQDTANRDIRDLIDRGILVRSQAGGRSTSYELLA